MDLAASSCVSTFPISRRVALSNSAISVSNLSRRGFVFIRSVLSTWPILPVVLLLYCRHEEEP